MNVTESRALDIIAACGADPARWPVNERTGVAALAGTPAVAAALTAARDLDALLGDWAVDVPPRDFDAAAIAASAGGRHPWRGWLAGAAMAAAVATGFAVLSPNTPAMAPAMVAPTAGPRPPLAAAGGEADIEAFATLFTPTADEDDLI